MRPSGWLYPVFVLAAVSIIFLPPAVRAQGADQKVVENKYRLRQDTENINADKARIRKDNEAIAYDLNRLKQARVSKDAYQVAIAKKMLRDHRLRKEADIRELKMDAAKKHRDLMELRRDMRGK